MERSQLSDVQWGHVDAVAEPSAVRSTRSRLRTMQVPAIIMQSTRSRTWGRAAERSAEQLSDMQLDGVGIGLELRIRRSRRPRLPPSATND